MIAVIGLLISLLIPVLTKAKEAGKSGACKNNLRQICLGLIMYVEENEKYPGNALYSNPGGPVESSSTGLLYLSARLSPETVRLDSNGDPVALYMLKHRTLFHCPARGMTNQGIPGSPYFALQYGYGYNSLGTLRFRPVTPLGLGPIKLLDTSGKLSEMAVHESAVKVPSEMIAIGDSGKHEYRLGALHPWIFDGGWTQIIGIGSVHNGGANVVFCDGHVEYLKQEKWIADSDEARKRWNNDNLPHRETW